MISSPIEAALRLGTLDFDNLTFHPQERVLRGVIWISLGKLALH